MGILYLCVGLKGHSNVIGVEQKRNMEDGAKQWREGKIRNQLFTPEGSLLV